MRTSSPLAAAVIATLSIGCGAQAYPAGYLPGRSTAVATTNGGENAAPIAQCSYEPGPLPQLAARRARASAAASLRTSADEAAATTGVVLDGGKLGHDPQVAVGDRFVVLYTAHHYRILDKATGELASAEPGDEVPPEADFGHLFSPLWSPVDKRGAPNATNLNRLLRFTAADALPCDEKSPLSFQACVQEFYDSRIMWDPVRKRFWLESAARNHLWMCGHSTAGDGEGEEDDDDEIGGDACDDPKYSNTQARRYIALAVSVSDDPRKGWHRYALTDEYTDWPKIAVQDRYLLLGYRSGHNVYVFDADKLAAGNPDRGPVRVAKIDARTLGGPIKVLSLVSHHGPTGGFALLVGSDGSGVVTPVGLYNPDPSRAAAPILVRGPGVDVGARFGSFEDNPVYRDGQLYLTEDECADGGVKCGPYRRARVVRLPTRPEGGPSPKLWAGADPAAGFLSFTLGGREPGEPADDLVSYEKPALDVNGRGDVVVVFARKGYRTRAPLPSEVRYAILYHGEAQPRASVLLKRGSDTDVPDVDDNRKAGIDLAYAQTDPTDDATVWVTHAYADSAVRWFRQVAATVRP